MRDPIPAAGTSAGLATPAPGARFALVLLLTLNLFNYIDRYILAAVLPKIEAEMFPHGGEDAKAKLGSLTTAFLVTYMVASPVFGWLAGHMRRWLLVGIGIILWSLASGGSGWAETFFLLFLTRCLVGVGEAAYGPVAPTMIADLYPVRIRGRVLAWFYMAIPVGSALGYVLGGVVADSPLGWRWAFYLVVLPGIILGVICFFMREPRMGQSDAVDSGEGEGRIESSGRGANSANPKVRFKDYAILFRTPSYVFNTIGMTAMTFVLGGVSVWMPYFIYERESTFEWSARVAAEARGNEGAISEELVRRLKPLEGTTYATSKAFRKELAGLLSPEEYERLAGAITEASRQSGLSLGAVNTYFGAIVVVAGLTATLLGGMAGDALRGRWSGSYFLVSAFGMLSGFPLFIMSLFVPLPWGWAIIFLAVFCLFFNTGPSNTALANVTHPVLRAPAFAVNIFIIHALGDAISPPIIGAIADRTSLETGFLAVSGVIIVAGLAWLWGARFLGRDTALAHQRLERAG